MHWQANTAADNKILMVNSKGRYRWGTFETMNR
jgi:hypothetical protein